MQKIKFALKVFMVLSMTIFCKHHAFAQTIVAKDTLKITPLPFKTSIQWVGDHPYDWNDGAMIPAKGLQQYINAGVNVKWKNFELQLAPELVVAQNLAFEGFSLAMDSKQWKDYYHFYNFIEEPERMGNGQYNKLLWGQSFVKYKFKNTAISISTANKYWGPSFRNALILSNNAAGFPHISIANDKPIQSKWGNFNYEFLLGELINGNYPPPNTYLTYFGEQIYAQKEDRARSFQATHINYTPKWFPNVTLGFEQSFMQYEDQLYGIANYIPLKNIIYRLPNDVSNPPITLTAFYFNYELPIVHAKIYGEYGWNLNRTTFRNWILQPDKGMANVLGFSKIFPTHNNNYYEFKAEMANLQLLTVAEQFTTGAPPSWYLGSYVRQGYTNDGQLLGAGVGPGGTSQTIEFNWHHHKTMIGLIGERRLHNDDFNVYSFTNSGDFRRFYVDFATTLKADWSMGKWDFGPRISFIQTNNYNWELYQPSATTYFVPGHDIQQFTGKLNLTYHF
jgi:Capsule assembly protein Wzi